MGAGHPKAPVPVNEAMAEQAHLKSSVAMVMSVLQ